MGVSGTRSITVERVQTLDTLGRPVTLISKTFSGEGTTGALLSQENLTYTERGAKSWDYTITREVFSSSLDEAGTIGSLTLTEKSRENYDDFSVNATGGQVGMKRLVSRTDAYQVPGQSPQVTTYTYINNPTNSTVHGRLLSSVMPDGSWKYNEYSISTSSPVSVTTEYSSWKDLPMSQRFNARKKVATVSTSDSLEESYIGSQLVSKSKKTATAVSGEIITTREKWDGSAWHITTTAYYPNDAPAPSAGRMKWIEGADGTATTYSYATASGNLVMTTRTGAGNRNGVTAGTQVITTYGLGNLPISQITTDIATNLITEQWDTDLTYNGGFDALGRPIKRIFNGDVSDYSITQYACCGIEFTRNNMGDTKRYFRDSLKRVYKTESKASSVSPVVTTFDTVAGLTISQTRRIGVELLFLGSKTISIDGLTTTTTKPSEKSTIAADRPVTTIVTTRSAIGDTVTTTYADGSTSTKAHYLSGSPKSTSGTAVPDMSYDYGTHTENGGGETTTITAAATATNPAGVVATRFTDFLGRTFKIVSGATGATTYAYHPITAAAGARTQLASMADGDGVVVSYAYNSEGQRINTSSTVPLASDTATRVTSSDEDVVSDVTIHGTSLGVAFRTTQTIASTGVSPIKTLQTFISHDGLISGAIALNGNTLLITTRPDPTTGISTQITTHPDGTKICNTYQHGLLTSSATLKTDNSFITKNSYTYDSLRRRLTSVDARTGTTTYDLNADGKADVTESGQPLAMKTPANHTTTMAYDIMGRKISTTLPDATVTYSSYYPTGKMKAQWGSQTNPVFYVYDEQNRMTEMRTYRNLAFGAEPLVTTTGFDTTTWIYSAATGFLAGKRDAINVGADYTYTVAGRLKSRKWARGNWTRYDYTQGFLTGTRYFTSGSTLPTAATGNDTATPDVVMTYEPLGRPSSITQTNQSQISYTYEPANLFLDLETIQYDIDRNGSYEFVRVLDRSRDSLLRDTGFDLKNGTTVENQAIYGYSAADGRMETVSGGGFQPPNLSNTFTYSYLPNSNLLEKVTGPVHEVINTWEPNRDVLDVKQNKLVTTVISNYDYTVNNIGQRTGVATSGTAFPATPPTWAWGYDSLGQVTSANSNVNTSDRAYQYDAIGNRKKTANSLTLPATDNYITNDRNQYNAFPGNSVGKTFDSDGNAKSYALPIDPTVNRTLTWDGENRLITNSGVSTVYRYDALGRRIANYSASLSTIGTVATLYFYDGWNAIAEYFRTTGATGTVPTVALNRTYLWGRDLSGSIQGAGGVGGLLSLTLNSQPSALNFFPTYDGNGNVSEYLTSTGAIAAHFEYDPFGNTVVNTDTTDLFSYRFSTKPRDTQTGLYYYGYRYYDPLTGRWLNRDPLGEKGGKNLYGMLQNRITNSTDYLGLSPDYPDCCGEEQKEVDDAQKEVDDAQKEVDDAQKEVDDAQKEVDDAQEEVDDALKALQDTFQMIRDEIAKELQNIEEKAIFMGISGIISGGFYIASGGFSSLIQGTMTKSGGVNFAISIFAGHVTAIPNLKDFDKLWNGGPHEILARHNGRLTSAENTFRNETNDLGEANDDFNDAKDKLEDAKDKLEDAKDKLEDAKDNLEDCKENMD
jgi:RHS repeat-associated protein